MKLVLLLLGVVLPLAACSQTRSERQILLVDKAYTADCPPTGYIGPRPDKCIKVKIGTDGAWYGFSQPIQGFRYEEGYLYELQVRVTYDTSGMMDVPPSYTLLRVVNKQKAG